jgi:selenocysteine lyase/cysteine desulfurase
MLQAALQQINTWKPENIQAYCKKITQKPLQKLRDAGIWVEDDDYRGQHLFGIRIPKDRDMATVQANIRKHKISVSFRGNAIRVAPHLYNSEADVNKLVKAILA